jgi:hypothetical protein
MNPSNSESANPTPPPRRTNDLFPDLESVRAAGIEGLTRDEARLVAAVLSMFISKGRSKTRSKVGIMIGLLVPACRVAVVRDGQEQPAALPDLPEGPWPHGTTAFRKLGIDHTELEAYWLAAKNRADDACLPLPWLLAFVPGPLWLAVLTLIKWGPYEAGVRAEEAVAVLARTPIVRGTRRRPEGSLIAAGTLENRVDYLWALMDAVVDLRAKVNASTNPSLPRELLEPWHEKPRRFDVKACGARDAHLDTAGPPIEDCSTNLRALYRDWQIAKPPRQYQKLRKLLVQALLALYGPRLDALRMIDVDDYLPSHVGSDGVRGPVLRLYPGTTRDPDEAYLLPLPEEVASWIEAWIRLTGRSVCEPSSPMWPSSQPKSGKPINRITVGGLYCAIAGREAQGGKGRQYALLPRGENPFIGFHPHAFRHTAYAAAKRAGVKAKELRPVEFAHIDPEDFARAVCGHSLQQSLKDVYRDLHQTRLARAAVEQAWPALWQGGKRHGLNPETIVRHRNETQVLSIAIAELERELSTLHARQNALADRATRLTGDALNAALIESNRLASQSQHLIRDLAHRSEQRTEALGRLEMARTTLVPLPDDLTPELHEQLLAAALADPVYEQAALGGPLADYLTVGDLARLYGRTPQAINNWYRRGFPGSRLYWDSTAWVVSGPRSKLLPVSAIDQTLLTEAQRTRLVEIRRQRFLADAA